MMPAAKHGDPQLGVDIHLCVVPPGATVPLPTPHMSIVFDPMDYVPFFGATVTVCGMKRAVAGTAGQVVHIPPGFPFAPKLPDKEDELFMGSQTVEADGDPFSYLGLPVLACQAVGMPSPPRPKRKGGPRVCMLPTVFNLAIPTNVFIGGPPTISLMALGMKAGFALLGKLGKAAKGLGGKFKALRQKLFKNLDPGFLKCTILRAEPVNILTGAVAVDQEDFTLPGVIPVRWVRRYASDNRRRGACGAGWESPVDARLELDLESGAVLFRHPQGDVGFFETMPARPGDAGAILEMKDGARLLDDGGDYVVRTKEDRAYRFPKTLAVSAGDQREYPLGRIDDRCGNSLVYERAGGRVVAIHEPGGRRIGIDWSADGLIRRVALIVPGSDSQHVFVEYDQDGAADLVEVRDALGSPYRFAYEQHHMLRHTDRNGLSFHYEYEPGPDDWRVVRAWGDGGLYAYKFAYLDTLGERRITDSLGNVSTVKLDERGLPISEIDPLGGMTIYEYDEACRTTAVVDPAGRRTEYHFDESGNMLRLVRPDGTAIVTEFQNDKAMTVTDAEGGVWRQSWDARGLLVAQADPLGQISRFEHDRRGQLATHVNARGAQTRLDIDGYGNLVGVTDALGHATRFAHDILGNTVLKDDPLGRRTRYGFDSKSRLIGAELPSGATIACAYDGEDNLTRYTDENGAVTRLDYFGQGEIARRVQPDGHEVGYLYDTEERLIGVRNQRGEVYRLHRDALGRVVEEVDYWGQSRRYAYDPGGHLVASIDPLQRRIDYACDPLGRIVRKVLEDPDGGAEPFVETFAYDPNGNLTATANRHVKVSRSFDILGQLIAEEQAHATGEMFAIENSYDPAGNRIRRATSTSLGAGHVVDFAYDLLDQCVGVTIDGGEPMRMERDALGQVIAEQLAPGLERTASYTADGLLGAQSVSKDGRKLFSIDYDYDPAGNLTRRNDSAFGVETFLYDPMGRIVEHLDPQGKLHRFLNDPAGDRLVTRTSGEGSVAREDGTDGWRREGRYQDTDYRFDRAGNLVAKAGPEFRLDLRWDANQRLVESGRTEQDGRGVSTRYAYDPLGRRLFKETAGRKTWFGFEGDALALDAVSDAPREFIYLPESFEPCAMVQDQALLYVNDMNGAPSRLVNSLGEVLWGARYQSFGDTDVLSDNISSNPIRLQGQYFDQETEFCINGARYFDSYIGAFISADPLGLEAGVAIYEYGTNVFSWIDPFGLECKLPLQVHHFATNKSKKWTAQMAAIAKKYGLKLDEEWNKQLLSHLGRHPNEYHEFVLDGMKRASKEAGNCKKKFLDKFQKYVKDPVISSPEMLRKAFWE